MIEVQSEQDMKRIGKRLGALLRGGETIELVGDVGAGKTTLTKGIAQGLEIDETVQSPSFTISRTYDARDNLSVVHYDFYRLSEAGIMASDVQESSNAADTVTIIEWAGVVADILPVDRLTMHISALGDSARRIDIDAGGERSRQLMKELMA